MYGGPILCFFQKELFHKNEYYFYFNKGISKFNLLFYTTVLYILLGLVILTILKYVKLA